MRHWRRLDETAASTLHHRMDPSAAPIIVNPIYPAVITIHSWFRWVALGLAIAATINATRDTGPFTKKPRGHWWDSFFMMALDLQVLFGMILYFGPSPLTKAAFVDVGVTLRTPSLRFWMIDHAGLRFLAGVLVRIGRVRAINATSVDERRRRRVLWFALTAAAMIAGIPWPFLSQGRPLFRF